MMLKFCKQNLFNTTKPKLIQQTLKYSSKPEIKLGIRTSNNLKMGIVGVPNVGKSTLFNALTKSNVPNLNFPFCTIDPNSGQSALKDERMDKLVSLYNPRSVVPSYLSITDIAGLVKGAAEGKGLGNAFLSHIRSVDGIFQVARAFEDQNVTHVEGSIDPVRDLGIIAEELRLKDAENLEKLIINQTKNVKKQPTREKQQILDMYQKLQEFIFSGKDIRIGKWNTQEVEIINPLYLLTAKPIVFLVNVCEDDYVAQSGKWVDRIKEWVNVNAPLSQVILFCGELEEMLMTMNEEEKEEYCKEKGMETAVQKVAWAGCKALHLIHYFTSGTDEVRAWMIQEGSTAPEAAGCIHTDFQRTFISAEVMSCNDLFQLGSEDEVKTQGKFYKQGKNYVVKDGDIIVFKSGK